MFIKLNDHGITINTDYIVMIGNDSITVDCRERFERICCLSEKDYQKIEAALLEPPPQYEGKCLYERHLEEIANLQRENEQFRNGIEKNIVMAFSMGIIPNRYRDFTRLDLVSFEEKDGKIKATVNSPRHKKTFFYEADTAEEALDEAYDMLRNYRYLDFNWDFARQYIIDHEEAE